MSFLSLALPRERNDPGLTNRGAGTSASRRALSASSVERTRLGRKCGRGYIGGINRIPIRGTCHLTASENLKSYSRDYSSPVVELRHLLEKHVARFVHERRKTLPFDSWSWWREGRSKSKHGVRRLAIDLPILRPGSSSPSLASSVPKFRREAL